MEMETNTEKIDSPSTRRQIVRPLLIVLIPLAIWTIGLIASWEIREPKLLDGFFVGKRPARLIISESVFTVCPVAAIGGMLLCCAAVKSSKRKRLAILWIAVPFLLDLNYILIFNGCGSRCAVGRLSTAMNNSSSAERLRNFFFVSPRNESNKNALSSSLRRNPDRRLVGTISTLIPTDNYVDDQIEEVDVSMDSIKPMVQALQKAKEKLASTVKFTGDFVDNRWHELKIQMTPYTPETEYVKPFPIEELIWKTHGVGIRRNFDFDKGDEFNDSLCNGIKNENDLIRVDISFDSSRSDIVYSLQRSDEHLNVWPSSDKRLTANYSFVDNALDVSTFVDSTIDVSTPTTIWVEYVDSGNKDITLSLIARDSATGNLIGSQTMRFHPFNSVACVFVDEGEHPGDRISSCGVNDWVIRQLANGYDVQVWKGGGNPGNDLDAAHNEILRAVGQRGVKQVALIGCGVGCDSVFNLSNNLNRFFRSGKSGRNGYKIVYTAYVDSADSNSAKAERPLDSLFHLDLHESYSSLNGLYANDFDAGSDDANVDAPNGGHGLKDKPTLFDVDARVDYYLTEYYQSRVVR